MFPCDNLLVTLRKNFLLVYGMACEYISLQTTRKGLRTAKRKIKLGAQIIEKAW